MQHNTPKKVLASAVISELQSSDMYLTLKARLFDLRANLNGVRVTEAFLDEIVENEDKYICIPLYADVRGLVSNRTIGHMYNARTGEFHSTQIGSFYHYEKEVDGDNTYLVGYARVMKRNKAICSAITDLFTDNALKFSFEIACGTYEEMDDGTTLIDADPRNHWEGEAIVTFPACEDAVALELVAECLGKGDENMADNKNEKIAEQAEDAVETIAETSEEVEQTETAETEAVAETVEDKEEKPESEDEEKTETAETEVASTIMVHQSHTEVDETSAYNCDTGEEVNQRVVVETNTRTPVEVAENKPEDEEKEESEEEEKTDEDDSEKEKKETASVNEDSKEEDYQIAEVLAEVLAEVKSLREEVASLKASHEEESTETVVAEADQPETVVGETEEEVPMVNPFTASISYKGKYSLLEKEENPTRKYSLLDPA